MKNRRLWLLLVVCLLFLSAGKVIAGQSELLIDKLVEKEIISEQEAQMLLEQGKKDSWVQTFKFKGDFLFRYQYDENDATTSGLTTATKRERARIRLRLGLEGKISEGWKVKAGLASGSADPRSTNQTLQDNFSSKPIQLDYAYATYDPDEYFKVLAGKIENKNTVWMPSNLLWDSDINPEGLEIKLQCNENKIFINTGYFIIDEISAGADPSMFFIQPGIDLKLDDINLKGAFNYYATNSVEGLAYSNIGFGGGTNSRIGTPASFQYDYDCWGMSGEVGKKEFIEDVLDYGAVFFDYIYNPDPSSENIGYLVGLKAGDEKIKDAGNWQAMINYRELEKDAWLDFLTNSSFLSGKTDVKGLEFVLQYAVKENISVGFTYYNAQTIKSSTEEDENSLLVDFNLKF
jgi:Putative porin